LEVATALTTVLQQRRHWRARFILSEIDRHPDYNARVLQELAPVRDRTTIETDMPFEHVKQCNERAAIAIIASTWQEPFGRTCLEAHAGGCAVISSGTGGLSEISRSSAHYLRHGHPNEIAEACLALIDDTARRERLASASIREAQRFDLSHQASQLDDFLRGVVQTARGDTRLLPVEGSSLDA
jgi:glycosyltransferase involved in cell wall biosynthesis